MKRLRRRFAMLLAVTLVVGGSAWAAPRSGDAHTCVVVGPPSNIGYMASGCQADAENPGSDHSCLDNRPTVTVIVCVDRTP